MPKNLPAEVRADVISPYSGGAWMTLCEIAVPGYSTQFLARNTEDVTYAGQVYDAHNLDIGQQVFASDGSVPRITLRVRQDVNGTIEQIINETLGASTASVRLIKVGEKFLDTAIPALEADYDALAVESDAEWVTFTLGIPNPLTQRCPLRRYSASRCPWSVPALFKGVECGYTGADLTCTGEFWDCLAKGNEERWEADLGLDPNVTKI